MGPRLHSPDELTFYLRKYLATHHEPTRKEALQEASRVLIHPRQILDSPLLAEGHLLKLQALVVSDAFEAATNGMENPEALAAMDQLPPDSLFYTWTHLIRAIRALYSGSPETCLAEASAIPQDSPLCLLVPVLKNLCGQPLPMDRRARELRAQIEDRQDSLSARIGQLYEALVTGMDEAFLSLFPSLLEDLAQAEEGAAARLTLWTLRQLEKYDLDYQTLFHQIKDFWGSAEGCRLIALGLYPVDPEAALLYWMAFVKELPQDHLHAQEALWVLEKMALGVKNFQELQGEGEGFSQDFRILLGQLTDQHPGAGKLLWPETWAGGTPPHRTQVTPKIRNQEKAPVQLDFFELFAS